MVTNPKEEWFRIVATTTESQEVAGVRSRTAGESCNLRAPQMYGMYGPTRMPLLMMAIQFNTVVSSETIEEVRQTFARLFDTLVRTLYKPGSLKKQKVADKGTVQHYT